MADTFNFDSEARASMPSGWNAGVTGRGGHHWTVEADMSAPSRPNVLRQSGRGDFPWCVRTGTSFADGFVEVKFKALAGKRIRVVLDGKAYIELDDEHIGGPGAVGVWTKADSVTVFDDFSYDGIPFR